MNAVGIDIGASTHAVALCQDGTLTARRKVLRVSQTREGFDELDRWLAGQAEISRVFLESSGHYWMPLVSHLRARDLPVALVNPVGPKYFAKRRLEHTRIPLRVWRGLCLALVRGESVLAFVRRIG